MSFLCFMRAPWYAFATIVLVASGTTVEVWANQWPESLDARFPLVRIFAKGHAKSFAGHSPGILVPPENEERDGYNFIDLGQDWSVPQECGIATRSSGYIQTESFKWTKNEGVIRVAFPLRIGLTFETKQVRDQLGYAPLLKLSLLKENKIDTSGLYSEISEEAISINRALGGQRSDETRDGGGGNSHEVVPVEFSDIFLSRAFRVAKGGYYSVRIQWNGDQICREKRGSPVRIGIGDQIRILFESYSD